LNALGGDCLDDFDRLHEAALPDLLFAERADPSRAATAGARGAAGRPTQGVGRGVAAAAGQRMGVVLRTDYRTSFCNGAPEFCPEVGKRTRDRRVTPPHRPLRGATDPPSRTPRPNLRCASA
jgi:hypothetical protein